MPTMETCMICNKKASLFRITHEVREPIPKNPLLPIPKLEEDSTIKDKLERATYIKEFHEETWILLDVCPKCLSTRGREISRRCSDEVIRMNAPLGRYKGKALHQMSREELIRTVHEIAQYKHYSETFQMVDDPTAMRRIIDGKSITGEDDEHR